MEACGQGEGDPADAFGRVAVCRLGQENGFDASLALFSVWQRPIRCRLDFNGGIKLVCALVFPSLTFSLVRG